MAGKVAASQATESFEFMLFEGDPDDLRAVVSTPNQISPWIDPSALKLTHRIGRGPFGDVWVATHHHRTKDYDRFHEVAVKMLYPIQDDQLQLFLVKFDEIFSECHGLQGVCFLHGISVQNGRVCIAMKFYEGSIGDKMARLKGGRLALSDVLRYGIDLAQGILELHSRRILILNIKPCNFLLDEHDSAVLGDFGIPSLLFGISLPSSDLVQRLGTPNYMAPEQWQPNIRGPLSFETDSWGFGCSIFEMLSGIQPWHGKSPDEIYHLVVIKKEKPDIPSGLPPQVANVLHGCFEYDLRNRPLISDILHAFQSCKDAVSSDSSWGDSENQEAERSSRISYTDWSLLKDHLQVGDTVCSRKPRNSFRSESMEILEGTVVGMENMEPPYETPMLRQAKDWPHALTLLPHLTLSTVAGRRPYRSLFPWLRASPLCLTSRSDGLMEKRGRVAVVVLGDIGRSPRMQYHALSLAQQAHLEVDIVANGGSDPHMAVKENQSIHLHKMTSVNLQGLSKISSPLALLLKATMQFIILVWFLCMKIPRPDVFVVQNPPSVPTLTAVKLSSWLRRSTFIIDWHNFGYTLLGLSHGRGHIIVKIYHWFEKYFGRMADGSLCVTKAMQHELDQNWGIKATVLYDQPPEFFHPASLEEKHELFHRLENNICHPTGIRDCVTAAQRGPESGAAIHGLDQSSNTLISTQTGNDIFLKANRPALVVSSTSWTPDEDFGILLEAAVMYDRRVAAALNEDDSVDEEKVWTNICNGKQCLYPRLLFIITGKGPERRKYEEKIKKLNLRRVAFRTMWLSAEDYPLLLGSADLGVSLHTSSSGLDLPMKVVDMFGCGLPVCAVSFSCITELVEVEKNGLLFSTSSELADEFMMLFKGFPEKCDTLNSLRDGALATASSARWSTEWETHALPLISEVISGKQ